jgi:hypothetical protein
MTWKLTTPDRLRRLGHWVMSTTATERRKNGKEILGPPQEAAELILGTLRQMGWQPASEGRRE